jgi:hypothetical protein
MTPDIFSKDIFPFLEEPQRAELLGLLTTRSKKRYWMLHELCNKIGVSPPEALHVMDIMHGLGVAKLQLLTYHCENIPILATDITEGFPSFPIDCPECQEEASSPDVRFDFRIDLRVKR